MLLKDRDVCAGYPAQSYQMFSRILVVRLSHFAGDLLPAFFMAKVHRIEKMIIFEKRQKGFIGKVAHELHEQKNKSLTIYL